MDETGLTGREIYDLETGEGYIERTTVPLMEELRDSIREQGSVLKEKIDSLKKEVNKMGLTPLEKRNAKIRAYRYTNDDTYQMEPLAGSPAQRRTINRAVDKYIEMIKLETELTDIWDMGYGLPGLSAEGVSRRFELVSARDETAQLILRNMRR